MTGKIFISYARIDRAFAIKLGADLRLAGIAIWRDADIPPGVEWDVAAENAINEGAGLIVIFSPSSVKSAEVLNEVSHAMGRGKRVLPVLHIKCDLPMRLKRLQYIDFTSDYDFGLRQLVAALGGSTAATVPGDPVPGDQLPGPEPPTIPVLKGPGDERDQGPWGTRERQVTALPRTVVEDHRVISRPRKWIPMLVIIAAALLVAVGLWLLQTLRPAVTNEIPSLHSIDFPKVRVGDPALRDCKNVSRCLERKDRSNLLVSADWNAVRYDNRALLSDCMGYQPCVERTQKAAAIAATNWAEVRFDDLKLADCMGHPGCLRAATQATKLRAVGDWRRVAGDDPLRKRCMGLLPCIERPPPPPAPHMIAAKRVNVSSGLECTPEARLPKCCKDSRNPKACLDCKRTQGILQNDYCGPN